MKHLLTALAFLLLPSISVGDSIEPIVPNPMRWLLLDIEFDSPAPASPYIALSLVDGDAATTINLTLDADFSSRVLYDTRTSQPLQLKITAGDLGTTRTTSIFLNTPPGREHLKGVPVEDALYLMRRAIMSAHGLNDAQKQQLVNQTRMVVDRAGWLAFNDKVTTIKRRGELLDGVDLIQ